MSGTSVDLPNGLPGFSAPRGAQATSLQKLARVTVELGVAVTLDDVAAVAVAHVADAIGAAVTTLMLVEDDRIVLVAGRALQPGIEHRWGTFGLQDVNPASEAARTGVPILLGDVAETERRYPVLRGQVPPGRSIVCIPAGGRTPSVAVLGLTFENGWLPGELELDLLLTFAGACGQTIDRIKASDEARARADQLTFLAAASEELGSSLDYRATLAKVAQLAVPTLADWCAVEVVDNGVPTTLAVAHVDPARQAWAWELQDSYPTDPRSATGSPNVIRTGKSELYAHITDEMLVAGARDAEHLALTRELNLHSALIVPLPARERTLGAITLVRAETPRPYGPDELALAEDLGRRAGVAIDNALLFREAQDTALKLQRAVLPDALDRLPDWDVAAHYEPGGRFQVGGDFYDAVQLPDGTVAVMIGDVMGHGVDAAAAMAQVRASLRAYLATDPDPAVVVGKLDAMFQLYSMTRLVTLVYAVIDPDRHRLCLVNAGHYPPMLISTDRTPAYLWTPAQLPLGAGGAERTATTVDFLPSDTLLMFTDGLIERRDEVIDVGLDRLAEAASALRHGHLDAELATLVSRIAHTGGEDDVTAFAVRSRTAAGAFQRPAAGGRTS